MEKQTHILSLIYRKPCCSALDDGEVEHQALPAELLHHEGEREVEEEGTAAEPGEPGPAI